MISSATRKSAPSFPVPKLKGAALRRLLQEFLLANGSCLQMPEAFKKPIKLFVKETFPHFILNDGEYFTSAYFTKDAVQNHKKVAGSLNITDLKGFIINLEKWSLELTQVPSSVFTSYKGLEVRLVIIKFSVGSDTQVEIDKKYPQNLYRDDDSQRRIREFLFEQQRGALCSAKAPFPLVKPVGGVSVKKVCADPGFTLGKEEGDFKGYRALGHSKEELMSLVDLFKLEKGYVPQAELQTAIDEANVTNEENLITMGLKSAEAKKGMVAKKSISMKKEGAITTEIKKRPCRSASAKAPAKKVAATAEQKKNISALTKKLASDKAKSAKGAKSQKAEPKKREAKASAKASAVKGGKSAATPKPAGRSARSRQ